MIKTKTFIASTHGIAKVDSNTNVIADESTLSFESLWSFRVTIHETHNNVDQKL